MSLEDITQISDGALSKGIGRARDRLAVWGFQPHASKRSQGSALEQVVTSTERLYGTYAAVLDTLTPSKALKDLNSSIKARQLLQCFALYVGCQEAATSINKELSYSGTSHIDVTSFNFGFGKTTDYELSIDMMVKSHMSTIEGTGQLMQKHLIHLGRLTRSIERAVHGDPELSGYLKQLQLVNLSVGGNIYKGFSRRSMTSEDNTVKIKPTSTKIIGNKDAKEELYGIINQVALYDPDAKTNIELAGGKPMIVLLYGRPGCGKTLMGKECIYRMSKIAEEKGIPSDYVIFDNSFKDPFHGMDTKNLRGKFGKLQDPEKLTVGFFEDIDGVIQNRNTSNPSHIENQSLNEILNQLDGLQTSYQGNYMLILSTNRMDMIDDALLTRVTVKVEVKGPTTPEDHAELMQLQLGSKKEYTSLTKQEWLDVGHLCHQHNFSGRDDEKIGSLAKKYISNPLAITNEYKLPAEHQQEALSKIYRPLTFAYLEDAIGQRHQSNLESIERDKAVRSEQHYQSMKMQLASTLRLGQEMIETQAHRDGINGSKLKEMLKSHHQDTIANFTRGLR
jgi:AAA+ superfamily predicted ATPase